MEKHIKLIREYSAKSYTKMTRTPSGQLKHQFIVPGSVYDHDLWDWDSWLTDVAVRQILSNHCSVVLQTKEAMQLKQKTNQYSVEPKVFYFVF